MYSIISQKNHFHLHKNNSFTQQNKQEIERLRTNPSFFTKTFETSDSVINFEQAYQFSPQKMTTSKKFDQRAYKNLSIHSRVQNNSQIDKQSIVSLLADIKILTFISIQNQQTKQYIAKKQKYLDTLRLQIEEKEESIKYQNMRIKKKIQQFSTRKLKIKRVKTKKLKLIEEQFDQLVLNIKKMKNKIKVRKLKTEVINNSSVEENKYKINLKQRVALPPCYFNNMLPPQKYFYLQHPTQPSSNQNNYQHFEKMEKNYQWQNKLNQSQFNIYKIQMQKMRTQSTYDARPNKQPLSTSRRGTQLNRFQNSQNLNKNQDQKASQLRNSNNKFSFKITDSKNKKKQQIHHDESKPKNNLYYLNYFSSEYESENQSRYITINNEDQTLKSKTMPVQMLSKQESQCFTYKKPQQQSQSDQWMVLGCQSRSKTNNKLTPKNVVDTIKIVDNKSERNSSKGSNLSNVNVNVTISSQEKNKQTVRSSSEQSKKHSVVQSVVAISMSGISSSKISKRSKANIVSEDHIQTKQANRYMPHLAKEFMKIEEENEQLASLKTTPNEFGTPRNTSINQKSNTPTNSQNKKKISIIEQQQQTLSPLNKPPALGLEKKDFQQVQNDGFLSKIRLNTQSKKFPNLIPIMSKEDDDLLAAICLVGQSKISRLRTQSQRMSASEINNDIDQISSLKVNSQIKKYKLQKDSQIDDFDFVLGGESNIVKKNKQTPSKINLQYSPSKLTEEKSRFSRGSMGYELIDNTIQQIQQQYDDYPSNKTHTKHKKRL